MRQARSMTRRRLRFSRATRIRSSRTTSCVTCRCRSAARSVGRFSDGEVTVEMMENVRGRDVFVVQPTCPPANDHLMELLVMVDACRRASAARITAVMPYFGYARQDRRPRATRVPITAKVVANMIGGAGVHRRADGRPARRPDPGVLRHPRGQRLRVAGAARRRVEAEVRRPRGRLAGRRRRGARARDREAARRCRPRDHRQAPPAGERSPGDEHHRRRRGQDLRAGRRHRRYRRARCATRRRR